MMPNILNPNLFNYLNFTSTCLPFFQFVGGEMNSKGGGGGNSGGGGQGEPVVENNGHPRHPYPRQGFT